MMKFGLGFYPKNLPFKLIHVITPEARGHAS
jgi:hypothetical protein